MLCVPELSATMQIMKKIIDPIDRQLIESELTPERLLRYTNKGNNMIYIVDAHNAPYTMQEIGRLREIAFRDAGGGTGKSCDIDEYDTMTPACQQLIVWNPDDREITGGYRFLLGENIKVSDAGIPRMATSHLFRFSERFVKEILPSTLELGRSFVALPFQSSKAGTKALYTLDNLWDGLGALTVIYPQIRYLFGKFTMYPSYGEYCRDLLLGFIHRYFPDPDGLAHPIKELLTNADSEEIQKLFTGDDFREDYRRLNHAVRETGRNIPPLVNAYIGLSGTMRNFGTAINHEFGDVEETGIFFKISDIFDIKKERHIGTYKKP